MIRLFRVLLIQIAKILPFAICFLLALSYLECIYSLLFDLYSAVNNSIIPRKEISWSMAWIVEYGWSTIVLLGVISFAVETCVWNKLSILYLCINLYEKDIFANIELYKETIILVCVINIIFSIYFVQKGIKVYIKNRKIKLF